MKMKIAFSGCRNHSPGAWEIEDAFRAIQKATQHEGLILPRVGGCPNGVDREVLIYFEGWPELKIFKADWGKHGKKAGPIRNKAMIDDADALVAFWDGKSRGTKNCIRCATDKGIPVLIMPANRK